MFYQYPPSKTPSSNLQVPGILFTPICPHSLSFRPLILPEHVTLRVQIPFNSRGSAWASFDGKDRKQLAPGDALVCSMAPWPVPTACHGDSTSDFLHSIHEGLHWNLRKTQSSDAPREAWLFHRLSFLLAETILGNWHVICEDIPNGGVVETIEAAIIQCTFLLCIVIVINNLLHSPSMMMKM